MCTAHKTFHSLQKKYINKMAVDHLYCFTIVTNISMYVLSISIMSQSSLLDNTSPRYVRWHLSVGSEEIIGHIEDIKVLVYFQSILFNKQIILRIFCEFCFLLKKIILLRRLRIFILEPYYFSPFSVQAYIILSRQEP